MRIPWTKSLLLTLVLVTPVNYVQAAKIHDAVRDGDIERVEKLTKTLKQRVNSVEEGTGLTPLHIAAMNGDVKMTQFLLSIGVKENILPSVLRHAIWNGHREVIDLLIENGAPVKHDMLDSAMNAHLCDDKVLTDIHYQAKLIKNSSDNKKARLELAKLLLEKGARADYINPRTGETSLMFAGYWGADMVELLLKNGADPKKKDIEFRATAMHYAAKLADEKRVFELLSSKGLKVDERDRFGNAPLYWASRGNNLGGATALLSMGADVNSKNQAGWTSLHSAIAVGYEEVAKFLITKRADVNARTNYGWTPLYTAAKFGRHDIIEMLIKYRAELDLADLDGRTPLEVAKEKGNKDAVKLLEKIGASGRAKPCQGDVCKFEEELRSKRKNFFKRPGTGESIIRLETGSGQYEIIKGDDEFAIIMGYDLETGKFEEPFTFSCGGEKGFDPPETMEAGKKVFMFYKDIEDTEEHKAWFFHYLVHYGTEDFGPGHISRVKWGPGGTEDVNAEEKQYSEGILQSFKNKFTMP